MEAELVALETTSQEAEWLRELLRDMPMLDNKLPTVLLHCDNQALIAKVKNKKENMKSNMHVKRRLKTVKSLMDTGCITVTYVKTDVNLADIFTKGVYRKTLVSASYGMGMRPADGQSGGYLA